MPQFSIIIPVYRVEEYLEKCVDSILAQTCQDFELLLIDDGSPDGSGAICDRYAASHPNQVRALHQPNGGAGAARNRGIELAQGDYLLFVDGDDWLAPNSAGGPFRLHRGHTGRPLSVRRARRAGTARSRASCTRSFQPIFPRIRRTHPSCSSASSPRGTAPIAGSAVLPRAASALPRRSGMRISAS